MEGTRSGRIRAVKTRCYEVISERKRERERERDGGRRDTRAHSAIIMSFTEYSAARLRRVTEITSLACGNIILIMEAAVSNCESNALFMPPSRDAPPPRNGNT